ncbi:50S ribosomal protein L25 [Nannocystaceae bacterium ST9]
MTENTFGKLTAQVRAKSGKGVSRKLRADGKLPAVMYGKGKDNLLLTVDARDLRRALDPERKLNTFFTVTVQAGGGEAVEQCIIADYHADPIRDEFLHVDFLRVDPQSEIIVKIPVEYVGRAVGVALGGKLRTHQRTVRIAVKPGDMPVKLTIDVTPLEPGQIMRMHELTIPNARILENPNVVVAHVEIPRVAKATTAEDPKKPAAAAKKK